MKITPSKGPVDKIKMKTRSRDGTDGASMLAEWWKAPTDSLLAAQLCGTASYLKVNQTYRVKQLAISVRLYSGLSVYSYAGANVSKMDQSRSLPDDRPTFNVIEAATDTLVSRCVSNEPQPRFLTDGSDYKRRHLAQELNRFILGELYQTNFYEKAVKAFRDACVMGTGALKIYRGADEKVCVDRVMPTDLYVDDNDSLNGEPQQLIQIKLVDRDKLAASNPDKDAISVIERTPNSYPDNAPDSGRTTADQIMVVEGWKLPSGPDPEAPGYFPGVHVIATVGGIIFKEEWTKPKFPFVFIKYAEPFLGYWGKGLGQRLFGNQLAINRLNYTISRAIHLTGVPRVLQENASKVVSATNNNEIGVIVKYSGVKPEYIVAPCNAAELYEERDRLIAYSFRQEGISDMEATGEKPAGLDSGEAIRTYDDLNTSRNSDIGKKYEKLFINASYHIIETAMEIAAPESEGGIGKYQTIYPNKDGTQEISLPQMKFLKDPWVIQCFSESSLPRTPAGRIATVTEQVQAGMLTIKEGRRLLRFPDLEQNEKLDLAAEERIFKILDKIVEDGDYTPPDPFMDLQLAQVLVVQYLNLYLAANLEEDKAELLRKFFRQVSALSQASLPPMPAPAPVPTANAAPAPTSPLVPNVPPGAAAA